MSDDYGDFWRALAIAKDHKILLAIPKLLQHNGDCKAAEIFCYECPYDGKLGEHTPKLVKEVAEQWLTDFEEDKDNRMTNLLEKLL